METKDKDNTWHLIRNDNGEWICDDKVVFLSRFEAGILQGACCSKWKAVLDTTWPRQQYMVL